MSMSAKHLAKNTVSNEFPALVTELVFFHIDMQASMHVYFDPS